MTIVRLEKSDVLLPRHFPSYYLDIHNQHDVGTGEQPCRQCHLANITCHYPPTSAKIVVPEVYVDKLQSRIFALEKALYDAVPDQATREEIAGRFGIKLQDGPTTPGSGDPSSPSTASWPEGGIFFASSPAMTSEDTEAEDEPGRLLHDAEGYSSKPLILELINLPVVSSLWANDDFPRVYWRFGWFYFSR